MTFNRQADINRLILTFKDNTSLKAGLFKGRRYPAAFLDLEHQIFTGLPTPLEKKLFSLHVLERLDLATVRDARFYPRIMTWILQRSIVHTDAAGRKATEQVLKLFSEWIETGTKPAAERFEAAEAAAGTAAWEAARAVFWQDLSVAFVEMVGTGGSKN